MVLALLAGTKTQTRRIVKWKPREPGLNLDFSGLELAFYTSNNPEHGWVLHSRDGNGCWNDRTWPAHPIGKVGDRLRVKEAIALHGERRGPGQDLATYVADGRVTPLDTWPWKRTRLPGMFMPLELSRITLEITEVRAQRLHDISDDDARAEGMPPDGPVEALINGERGKLYLFDPRTAYAYLWDSINGRGSWKSNPWVWALTFKRLEWP